jgi:hypothetical protein
MSERERIGKSKKAKQRAKQGQSKGKAVWRGIIIITIIIIAYLGILEVLHDVVDVLHHGLGVIGIG